MKAKQILDDSANRGEFNRAYKHYLEKKGKIHCAFCRYHKGENSTKKWYGGREKANGTWEMTYPNWKLVSKNRKQWQKKPIKTTTRYYGGYERIYIGITW